jgi:hypothetical protein
VEGEPPHELPGGLLDGRPVAVPRETLAVLALDLLAGRRLAAVDATHDLEVVVEREQAVDVGLREAAQQQPLGLQEDAHFSLHLRRRKRGQHSRG